MGNKKGGEEGKGPAATKEGADSGQGPLSEINPVQLIRHFLSFQLLGRP